MLMNEPISESFRIPLGFGPLPGFRVHGIVRSPWRHPIQIAGLEHGWCCQCVDKLQASAWEEIAEIGRAHV